MRLFTAILLSDEARDHLDRLGERLAQFLQLTLRYSPSGEIKWVAAKNLHLTLKFFGEVEDDSLPELVERLRSQHPAGRANHMLRANRLVLLPPRRGPVRVIAVGVGDDPGPLKDAYAGIERVAEDFGIPRERRPFTPHLTLARCRVPIPIEIRYELEHWPGFTAGPYFNASSFALVESALKPSGPEYRTIAEFPMS